MKKDELSRREFFAVGTGAAAAGLVGSRSSDGAVESASTSRVVLIRDRAVLDENGRADAEILHRMLNRGLAELLRETDSASAWRRLFSPTDVVGIKSNVWGRLPTPQALEDAMRTELESLGIAPEDIAVDDRNVKSNPV